MRIQRGGGGLSIIFLVLLCLFGFFHLHMLFTFSALTSNIYWFGIVSHQQILMVRHSPHLPHPCLRQCILEFEYFFNKKLLWLFLGRSQYLCERFTFLKGYVLANLHTTKHNHSETFFGTWVFLDFLKPRPGPV